MENKDSLVNYTNNNILNPVRFFIKKNQGMVKNMKKLENIETFIQVNYRKWYTYIDKAWELVNSFYEWDTPPQFNMRQDILEFPSKDRKSAYKIWIQYFRMNFHNPVSLDYVKDTYLPELDKVKSILGVNEFTRIWIRQQYIHSVWDIKDSLNGLISIPDIKLNDMQWSIFDDESDLNINFIIKRVFRKLPDNSTEKKESILIDIDIFTDKVSDVDEWISSIISYHHSDKILQFVNQIIWHS